MTAAGDERSGAPRASERAEAAFGDVAVALGALALGRVPDAAGWAFLLVDDAPADLWRPLVHTSRQLAPELPGPRPGAAGGGTVIHLAAGLIDDTAFDEPALVALRAALDGWRAPRARVRVMGIVNVTPDSFSDGGRHLEPERAVAHGLELLAEGAEILDVGGESTRPGAAPVPADEELRRVLPVIAALAREAPAAVLSVDTMKAEVARAAVAAGAHWVNDVSGGEADPAMLPTVAELGVHYIAMHRRGTPSDMQCAPAYGDVALDVAQHLRRRVRACLDSGLQLPRITLDPGIGFGKRLPHNLALLARMGEFRSLGLPLLVGPSRKAFIGHVLGAEREQDWATGRRSDRPEDRVGGTATAVAVAVACGASVVRVHDVRVMVEATRVAEALAAVPAP